MSQTDIADRYDIKTAEWGSGANMEKSTHGDWVRVEDYDTLRERLDAVEKERDAAREYVGRWVRAMSEHYPLTWAMDPTNPELCIGNIVRFRQDQTDQLRLSNERLREALKAWQKFDNSNLRNYPITVLIDNQQNARAITAAALTAESGTEGKG